MSTNQDRIDNIVSTLKQIKRDLDNNCSARESAYRNKFIDLKFELDHELRVAQLLYDDVKRENLTANMIEAEGCLRGMKGLYNLFMQTFNEAEEEYVKSNKE